MSEVDVMLYRPILSGEKYEKVIPKGKCEKNFVGKGMTDFTITQMQAVVETFGFQADDLADQLETEALPSKLPFGIENDYLGQMAFKIHYFLYNHFSYRADLKPQFLRTLACSWFDRQNGLDCKSYSIAASSILTSLEIRHFIRKIKQASFEAEAWTHVYVIVPKNQKTGGLSDGYYTIDGTIPTMVEPSYTEKSDLEMSLPHYVLNGAHSQGMNGINMNEIKNLFSSFGCIGGSGFTEGAYKWAQESMIVHYTKLIDSANASIVAKDFAQLSEDFNEILGTGKATVKAYELKLSQKKWNACTSQRLRGMIALSKFYRDVVGVAVEAYATKYFSKTAKGSSLRYNASYMEGEPINFKYIYTDPHIIIDEPAYNYQFLAGVTSIPRLEITQYVADNVNTPASFNAGTFLQGLSQILVSFQPNTPNPSNPNVINDPVTGQPITVTQPGTKKMGAGTVVGLLLVTAGLAYAFTKTPDKRPVTTNKAKK